MMLMIIPYIFICFAILVGVALGIESQDQSTEPCTLAFWIGVIVLIVCVCMAIHVGAYAAAAGV